jgi:hypothetical protein
MTPTLTRNLIALAAWDVDAVQAIHAATPRDDLPGCPPDTADALAASVDLPTTFAAVLVGFDAQCVRAMLGRMYMPPRDRRRYGNVCSRKGDPLFRLPVIVYETDLSRVRHALERVDLSAEIAATPLVFVTDPGNLSPLRSCREALTLGTTIADVPGMEPAGRTEFVANLARYAVGAGIDLHTAAALSDKLLDNALANVERYATGAGVLDLKDAAKGRPALSIAAGPSLDAALDTLARPGVRDRFVIVAAQTVLKVLLARGIVPHFVTAIDHHDICRRFYDGLTPDDVRGVQLVANPRCSPAILEAFPGPIRLFADPTLDAIIGKPRDMGALRLGGSVAHLSYFLARHLGCDPVVLVGHDLAFTGGRHYASGAGIVDRTGVELIEAVSVDGGTVYTDRQMTLYLEQFEREFAADAAAGLVTLDGTGGGVRKRHAAPIDLAGFVRIASGCEPLRAFADPAPIPLDPGVPDRVRRFRSDLERVRSLRDRGERLLSMPKGDRRDATLRRIRDRVQSMEPARSIACGLGLVDSLRRLVRARASSHPTPPAHQP